jgi:hypothetical protein
MIAIMRVAIQVVGTRAAAERLHGVDRPLVITERDQVVGLSIWSTVNGPQNPSWIFSGRD